MQQPETKDFKVDEVLNTRVDPATGVVFYYVRWLGYGDEENTWEWEQDMIDDGHSAAIEEYKARESQRTGKSARSRTPEPVVRRFANASDTPSSRRGSTPSRSKRVIALLNQDDDEEEEEENTPRRQALRPTVVDLALTKKHQQQHRASLFLVLSFVFFALGEELLSIWSVMDAETAQHWFAYEGSQVFALLCNLVNILLIATNYPLTKGAAVVGTGLWLAAVSDPESFGFSDIIVWTAYLAMTLALDKFVEQQTLASFGNMLAGIAGLGAVYLGPQWKLASVALLLFSSLAL